MLDVSPGARHLGQRRRRRDLLRLRFQPSSSHWDAVGGTSIAAPLLAGVAADIAQGCQGGRLGNFAPRLNALAATHVYGSAFTDVTTGINWPQNITIETPGSIDLTRNHAGAFKTAKGFDLATGLGVPIASGLACPRITSMTPNHGFAGMHVTLHGVGLERATIKFGTRTAKVLSAGSKRAVVVVPKGAGTVSGRRAGPDRHRQPRVVLVSGRRHRRVPDRGRRRRGLRLRRRARVRIAEPVGGARADRRHGRRPRDRRLLARGIRRQRLQLPRAGRSATRRAIR